MMKPSVCLSPFPLNSKNPSTAAASFSQSDSSAPPASKVIFDVSKLLSIVFRENSGRGLEHGFVRLRWHEGAKFDRGGRVANPNCSWAPWPLDRAFRHVRRHPRPDPPRHYPPLCWQDTTGGPGRLGEGPYASCRICPSNFSPAPVRPWLFAAPGRGLWPFWLFGLALHFPPPVRPRLIAAPGGGIYAQSGLRGSRAPAPLIRLALRPLPLLAREPAATIEYRQCGGRGHYEG